MPPFSALAARLFLCFSPHFFLVSRRLPGSKQTYVVSLALLLHPNKYATGFLSNGGVLYLCAPFSFFLLFFEQESRRRLVRGNALGVLRSGIGRIAGYPLARPLLVSIRLPFANKRPGVYIAKAR